jgi:hypothetical protein
MDTHQPGNGASPTTGIARLRLEAVVVPPKPVTLRGRELAERIERNFPHELRAIPRWVGWKWERKEDGNWTKPPYCITGKWLHPKTGKWISKASSTDPASWTTFENAVAALKKLGCTFDGIGLVPDERIVGIDVDHFLDHPGAVGEVVGIGGWRNLRLVQPARAGVVAPAEITP